MTKMKWYSARLLFRSVIAEKKHEKGGLFEEKLMVLRSDEQQILKKVKRLAGGLEHSYTNAEGNRLSVRFLEILEIQDILAPSIKDGTEVFFRFLDKPNKNDLQFLRKSHEHPWWKSENKGQVLRK